MGMKSTIAYGIKRDKYKAKLREFKRLYHEASETARDHEEFLENIFTAAVNLHTGKWKASAE